jgi:DNA-binding NtrC family response regulator
MDLQIRLLRVLQEKQIERIGSNQFINLNVRIIAATNENLSAKVQDKKFRADLYHRLNVFHIHLPPLKDRKEDIPLLAGFFIKKYAKQYGKKEPVLSAAAVQKLENLSFSGNVRELENIIEKTIILSDKNNLSPEDLMTPESDFSPLKTDKAASLPQIEAQLIVDALKQNNGSLKKAAQKLGITYKTLQYRLKKFGIDKRSFK